MTVLQFSDALNHLPTISSQVKSRKQVTDLRRHGTEMNVLELGLTMEGPKQKLLQNACFKVKHERPSRLFAENFGVPQPSSTFRVAT